MCHPHETVQRRDCRSSDRKLAVSSTHSAVASLHLSFQTTLNSRARSRGIASFGQVQFRLNRPDSSFRRRDRQCICRARAPSSRGRLSFGPARGEFSSEGAQGQSASSGQAGIRLFVTGDDETAQLRRTRSSWSIGRRCRAAAASIAICRSRNEAVSLRVCVLVLEWASFVLSRSRRSSSSLARGSSCRRSSSLCLQFERSFGPAQPCLVAHFFWRMSHASGGSGADVEKNDLCRLRSCRGHSLSVSGPGPYAARLHNKHRRERAASLRRNLGFNQSGPRKNSIRRRSFRKHRDFRFGPRQNFH